VQLLGRTPPFEKLILHAAHTIAKKRPVYLALPQGSAITHCNPPSWRREEGEPRSLSFESFFLFSTLSVQ